MSTLPDMTGRPSSYAADHVERSTTSSWPQAEAPPSYPPTEVQRWLICPVFRDYSTKWEPRLEAWTPHQLVGTAIHAGIAAYLRPLIAESICLETDPEPDPEPLVVASETLRAGYVQQEAWGLAGLEALVRKGARALIASVTEHLLPDAQVVGVECVVKRNTNVPKGVPGEDHIADCILQRGNALEIWDWKVSLNVPEPYLPDRLLEAHHSWQLLDYAWHTARLFGMGISRVGQALVILGPKLQVAYSPVAITPERLNQWRIDSNMIWNKMEHGGVWHNWQACTDKHLFYGKRCPMFEGCHTFFGDERLFPALYRPISSGGT